MALLKARALCVPKERSPSSFFFFSTTSIQGGNLLIFSPFFYFYSHLIFSARIELLLVTVGDQQMKDGRMLISNFHLLLRSP